MGEAEAHIVALARLPNGDIQIDDGISVGSLNEPWARRCFGAVLPNGREIVTLEIRPLEPAAPVVIPDPED